MKEEKFPNSRKPSHPWVYGEFWDLRAQHNWEEKKNTHTHTHTHTHTEYVSNHNSQWRSSPDDPVCQQQVGAEQGGTSYMFKVRTCLNALRTI